MGFGDNYEKGDPLFNGSWQYLKLLGDIIAMANGALVSGDIDEYHRCLTAWFNEVQYRIKRKTGTPINSKKKDGEDKKSNKGKIPYTEYELLVEARKKARKTMSWEDLELFHLHLNKLTHKSKLRMVEGSTARGWQKDD